MGCNLGRVYRVCVGAAWVKNGVFGMVWVGDCMGRLCESGKAPMHEKYDMG